MTSFPIFRDGEAGLSRVSLLADGCVWLTARLLDSLHLAVCGRGTEGGRGSLRTEVETQQAILRTGLCLPEPRATDLFENKVISNKRK